MKQKQNFINQYGICITHSKAKDDVAATIDNIEIVPDCEVEGDQSYQQRKQKYQQPRQKLIGN